MSLQTRSNYAKYQNIITTIVLATRRLRYSSNNAHIRRKNKRHYPQTASFIFKRNGRTAVLSSGLVKTNRRCVILFIPNSSPSRASTYFKFPIYPEITRNRRGNFEKKKEKKKMVTKTRLTSGRTMGRASRGIRYCTYSNAIFSRKIWKLNVSNERGIYRDRLAGRLTTNNAHYRFRAFFAPLVRIQSRITASFARPRFNSGSR